MDKKYETVKACLMDSIRDMKPNEKLPSERDMIEKFHFSRPTIQRALADLESDGVIYRRSRQGAFVSDRKLHKSLNKLMSFAEDLEQSGDVPFTKLLTYEKTSADEEIANRLLLNVGDEVYHIIRLRYKNGVPIIYDNSFFSPFSIVGITCDDLVTSIYSFIEAHGRKVMMAKESFSAVMPPEAVVKPLMISPDEPVIRIDKVAFLSDDRPFEYTISYKNPKKYFLELTSYR